VVSRGGERVGSVVADSYRLMRLIGEGGMGAVYEAEHLRVPRRFAVKILKPEIAANRDMFDRFRREAEIASASGHEHIVEVIDFNVLPDGAPYMVLELLDGETLAQRIHRRGRLTLDETARLIDSVASALHAVHAKGIVHRDLKPQNLFLIRRSKRDDFLKVLDFGISKVVHEASLVTQEGQVLGTPNYMAPEQLAGFNDSVDARTDVFALGAIAWECLAGRVAFQGPSVPAVTYQICHGAVPSLRALLPDVPPEIEVVIARALEKRQIDRWPGALAFRDAFLRACGKTPSNPPPRESQIVLQSGDHRDAIGPTIASGATVADPAAATLAAQSADLTAVVPKRSPLKPIAILIAIVAVGGGVLLLRSKNEQPRPAPTPSAFAVASTPIVPMTPEKIELRIGVDPASATIRLDGAPSTSPMILPRDGSSHELTIEASGYTTDRRTLIADRDRELQIVLTKTTTAPVAAPVVQKPIVAPAKPTAPSPKPTTTIEIKGPTEKSL